MYNKNPINLNEASLTFGASQMQPYSCNIDQVEQQPQPHEFMATLTDQNESMKSYSIDKCML